MSLVERNMDAVLPSYVFMLVHEPKQWFMAGATEGLEMVSFYINDANSGMMQSANNEICGFDYCVLLCVQCILCVSALDFSFYNYSHCCILHSIGRYPGSYCTIVV